MLFHAFNCETVVLEDPLFVQKRVSVSVLRLDKIHPIVSGNKLFKLHYFLESALLKKHSTIVSSGGAWSNHLVATAFASRLMGFKSIGIVRGESPANLSTTLTNCINYGMELHFISRKQFDEQQGSPNELIPGVIENDFTIIPQGGYDPIGAKGASLIMEVMDQKNYSHLCTAVGTATTLAGLLMAAKQEQTIVGVNVLKGEPDTASRLQYLMGTEIAKAELQMLNDFHFGGYAKKTPELIAFMNELWIKHQLPTDFVYTGKLFYGIYEAVRQDKFPQGSCILCIHTGGLQGNDSLSFKSLLY